MRDVLMPQMGYDMTQGTIVRWLKKVGDRVHKGDIIAEIETDKANVEIEAFESGTVLSIVADPGETVPVGQPIAVIGEAGETPPERPREKPRQPAAEKTAPAPPTSKPAQPATRERAAPASPPPPEAALRPPASPLARRLARELGVGLESVRGSGPGGRITRVDVEEAAAAASSAPASGAGATAERPPLPEGAEDVELSRLRQTVGRRMTQAKQQAPHFYVSVDVRVDGLLKLKDERAHKGVKVSLNDLLVRGLALALAQHPEVNAAFMDGVVRRFQRIDIGVAIATDAGLLSPALIDCRDKPIDQIATETRDLVERAKAGRLHPQEMGGGTVTLSNLGMFGIDSFMAIINPPQALIVAVGAAEERPTVDGGRVRVARMLTVWASADHRVLDGADVARFLATFRQILEDTAKLGN